MRRSIDTIMENMSYSESSNQLSCVDQFLGDESIKKLCERLKGSDSDVVEHLTLRGNCIGPTGAKSIADYIHNHHKLKFLSMEWNQIGLVGVQYMADALRNNRGLTHLDLRNNSIDSTGAIALSTALKDNSTLLVLDLRWNQIEDNGATSFKAVLLSRFPKLTVNFGGNRLTESTIKLLEEWATADQKHFEPLPVPPAAQVVRDDSQSFIFQNDLLQKEVTSLRQQSMSLQSVFADVQRQLDSSSLRVTDLEQQLSREEYRFAHLSDTLKQANSRVAVLTDEQKAQCMQWERERALMREELLGAMQTKSDEIRAVCAERDAYKDRLMHSEEENARLKLQIQNLTQQYESDRSVNDSELRQALNRVNDLSISETKLKSEVTALRATNNRLTEKQSALTEELDCIEREHDRTMRVEHERYNVDTKKLRSEQKTLSDRMTEKMNRQTREVNSLQATLSQLTGQHSKQIADLEQSHSEALNESRNEERTRSEQTIRDLKQRFELVTQARVELDQRTHSLSNELKTTREEHRVNMEQLQIQLADMENELQRQRSQNTNTKTLLASVEADVKVRTAETEDLRKRLRASQEQADGWSRELQAALVDKQTLITRSEKSEQQCIALQSGRATEYASIQKHVLRAVEKELETLRVDMKIRAVASSASTSNKE